MLLGGKKNKPTKPVVLEICENILHQPPGLETRINSLNPNRLLFTWETAHFRKGCICSAGWRQETFSFSHQWSVQINNLSNVSIWKFTKSFAAANHLALYAVLFIWSLWNEVQVLCLYGKIEKNFQKCLQCKFT